MENGGQFDRTVNSYTGKKTVEMKFFSHFVNLYALSQNTPKEYVRNAEGIIGFVSNYPF